MPIKVPKLQPTNIEGTYFRQNTPAVIPEVEGYCAKDIFLNIIG